MDKIKRIPYGMSDFEAIHCENEYYVDKTMFIPEIEKTKFVFLIRPRRFGKSLFLSMLHSYYDINRSDRFEKFYKGTWIFDNPTEFQGKYMTMSFNFSVIAKDKDRVQKNFNDYCLEVINNFVFKYKKYLNKRTIDMVKSVKTSHEKLQKLCIGLEDAPTKLYIFIDEYDNFTNSLLSEYGVEEYNKMTKKAGYFKEFFTVLKALATGSGAGLARMFITGVSPITMDDVTSGMNIGDNVSTDEELNECMGFTEKDLSEIIDYYTSVDDFHLDKVKAMKIMKQWYDGYKFARRAESTMYNTDMILYYMNKARGRKFYPDNLIDDNCKTDYRKFKHFTTINHRTHIELNGNFGVLEKIMQNGYIIENLETAFPFEQVTKTFNFVSLLYYFGLLTIDKPIKGRVKFVIPNASVKKFLSDFVVEGYEDAGKVTPDTYKLHSLLADMMFEGEWKEPIEMIAAKIDEGMNARDKIEGERYIQAYLSAMLGLSKSMIVDTEKNALDGYCDLTIAPFLAMYPDIEYAYLIEIKYLKQKGKYTKAIENSVVKEATAQLANYAKAKNIHKEWQIKPHGTVNLKKIILIFKGRVLKYYKEV